MAPKKGENNMENCSLGCTIALPGYQNIKVEVSAEGYIKTKEYLRSVLMAMCIEPQTTAAIEGWWKRAFGKDIKDDFVRSPPTARPLPIIPTKNEENKPEFIKGYIIDSDSGSMEDLKTQNFFSDMYDGE